MKAHFYTISGGFASRENMPVVFRAAQLAETAKAVYLYGHADPQKAKAYGKCCRCGRQLTHPGSIMLGIGPECLGNWDLRDVALNELSSADIEALTTRIAAARRVDSWFPKAVIVDQEDAPDLEVPADHPKLKNPNSATGVVVVGNRFEVRFPYDPAKVSAMRAVMGRRWDAGRKLWILPHTKQAVEVLRKIGLEAPEIGTPETLTENKNTLYFSLCPLYAIHNGLVKNIDRKEWENAKRCLYQKTEQETGHSNEKEFCKGQNTGSQKKSSRKIEGVGQKSRMVRKSIESDQRSNATTRSEKETFSRTEKSQKSAWNQFPGWEWTIRYSNNIYNGQDIVAYWIYSGISNKNPVCSECFQKCSQCLQSRLRKPNNENSYRTGRTITQERTPKETGSEKNNNTESPWLDCNTLAALTTIKLFPGFERGLYRFQLEDVLRIKNEFDGRVLLGSEMGLGKTIQALAYIHANPDKLPALVICPASLKLNWDREAAVACPNLRRYIISGKKSERLPPADIYIINYDIMAVRLGDLMSAGIQTMILDECHYLKNRSAQRTKAVLGSGTKHPGMSSIPYIIALSGTPILNRPAEVYPVIKTLAPKQIPAWMTFAYRYCGARHNGFGWDFAGSSNTEELHQLLTNTVMIRRLKTDVLKDLPAKQRSALPMEMSSEVVKDYAAARSNFITWLKSVDPSKVSAAQRAETLVQFQALKRLAARGKWKAATDWLKDSLESNGKIIVFAVHHEAIDKLMEDLKDFRPVKVDGRDSQEARQAAVDRFQNDETCRLFVGNIKAAGVGLTLTEASAVAFLELGWTPGEHVQAEDRAHRIGQTKSVNIYYLVAADTVEEEIAALLDKKQKVLDAVLDGAETDQDSLLSELLKQYMEQSRS